MKKIKLIFLLLLACPIMALYAQVSPQFGFAGDRNNTFVVGSQNSIAIWKQWCALHAEGDVEGIVALAADSIRIEAPGGEVVIEGVKLSIEELESYIMAMDTTNKVFTVKADEGRPYGEVISVLRAIKKAGISDVSLGTSSEN